MEPYEVKPVETPPEKVTQVQVKHVSKTDLIKNYQRKRREEFWCNIYKVKTFEQVLASKVYVTIQDIR